MEHSETQCFLRAHKEQKQPATWWRYVEVLRSHLVLLLVVSNALQARHCSCVSCRAAELESRSPFCVSAFASAFTLSLSILSSPGSFHVSFKAGAQRTRVFEVRVLQHSPNFPRPTTRTGSASSACCLASPPTIATMSQAVQRALRTLLRFLRGWNNLTPGVTGIS